MRLAPYGRREVAWVVGLCGTAAVVAGWFEPWTAAFPLLLLAFGVAFFRDPERRVPSGSRRLVAPADGVVTEITEVEEDRFLGGAAWKVGIFLSVFDVHINRAPCDGEVRRLEHRPGRFLNAMNPASSDANECQWIELGSAAGTDLTVLVRQVAGAIARRIVCAVQPGQRVRRGERFGMIKFGSRTELYVPRHAVSSWRIRVGDRTRAGETVLGELDAAGLTGAGVARGEREARGTGGEER